MVEAILALAIFSILSGVLWQTFGAARREAVAAEHRLQSVIAFQRLSQALESDLARLIPIGEGGGISIGERGRVLEFQAVEVDATRQPGQAGLTYRPWTYRFRADEHIVMRTVRQGGALELLPNVRLKDLVFARSGASYDPAAIGTGPLPPADTLVARAVWVPPEDLVAGRATPDKDTVTITLPFGLVRLSDPLRFPGWVTNPTSRASSATP